MQKYTWQNIGSLSSRSFICGYCGNPLASEKGKEMKQTMR